MMQAVNISESIKIRNILLDLTLRCCKFSFYWLSQTLKPRGKTGTVSNAVFLLDYFHVLDSVFY